MDQKTALEIMKTGENVFLTGPAGSGKTYVLNQYIDYLESKGVEVAVTASTGIAATHIGGKTIHSWSGLGVKDALNEKDLKRISGRVQLRRQVFRTKVLIIDEISMLSASQLDMVNEILRYTRKNELPFSGIQMIFCGDFFQLPPVGKDGRSADFAYASKTWDEMDIKICYLDEQHRQKDTSLTRVLSDIRKGSVTRQTKEIIESCQGKALSGDLKPAKLFTHNVDVDYINERELGKINGKSFAYNMKDYGKANLVESLKKSCLAPERLILKKGAQVMFVKNNFDEGYVNGTMGKMIGFDKETKMPIVETTAGKLITVQPATWELEENDEPIASIRQIPLRLAWAITVHKSQGMSLDMAEIDLGKSFEYGMGYVALSRVRTLSGLSITGINKMAFEVHPDAHEKDLEFVRLSNNAAEDFSKMSREEMKEKQKAFVGDFPHETITKKNRRRNKDDSPKDTPATHTPKKRKARHAKINNMDKV